MGKKGPSDVGGAVTNGQRLQVLYTALKRAAARVRFPSGMSLAVMCDSEQPCVHLPKAWKRTHMGAFCARLIFFKIRVSRSTDQPYNPGIFALKRSIYSTPGGSFHSGNVPLLAWEEAGSGEASLLSAAMDFFFPGLSVVAVPPRLFESLAAPV